MKSYLTPPNVSNTIALGNIGNKADFKVQADDHHHRVSNIRQTLSVVATQVMWTLANITTSKSLLINS